MTDQKILVLAGCSKRKLDHPAPAGKLNQGTLFKKSRKLAKLNEFDLKILSGKYGLLDPEECIAPYNQKIRTKADIERIKGKVQGHLLTLWQQYDVIITVLGKKYEDVLSPVLDNKFRCLYHQKGLFGYIKLLNSLLKLNTQALIRELERFTAPQCAHVAIACDKDWPRTCKYCRWFNGEECLNEYLFLPTDWSQYHFHYPKTLMDFIKEEKI